MSDLVKRLRIKAGMIEMGELIAWGSDSALMREAADALEMAAPAVQGEPVGWQFYQDGKWWYGDDRIKLHRKNTEAAGIPVRDVYAVPQSVEQQPDAAPAAHGPLFLSDEKILEIASNPMVTPCSPWWLKNDVKSGDVQNSAIAFARAVLKAAAPAVQVEPVTWPLASKEEAGMGWSIDYRFLEQVEKVASLRTGFTTSMEAAEQVLIAAAELLAAYHKGVKM